MTVTVSLRAAGGATKTVTLADPTVTNPTGTPANRPANPAAIVYNSVAGNVAAWAKPGSLVVAGRDNFDDPVFHTLAAGGATVLIYLHAGLMNYVGKYHKLLYNASQFGGSVPSWPNGPWRIDEYGNLPDFRVGSLLNQKLVGVLNLIVSENPHIAGIFFDGLGTRATPGNGGFSWDSFPDKDAYRAGAIEQVQIGRKVADANNLFLMVNANWQAGNSTYGGGYPDRNQHGCSLVDGCFIEEHPVIDDFYTNYCSSTQWASATPRKKSYMWASNVGNVASRTTWKNSNLAAFSSSSDYINGFVAPWGSFTDFGMPRR